MSMLLGKPDVLKMIPMSKKSWDMGVKNGLFPQPVDLGGRKKYWRVCDIEKLIEKGISKGEAV